MNNICVKERRAVWTKIALALAIAFSIAVFPRRAEAQSTEPTCTAGTNSNTGGTSIVIGLPSGAVNGSVLMAFITSSGNDTGWSPPAGQGWSVYQSSGTTPSAVVWTTTFSGTPPSTFTFTGLNGGPNHSGIIVACDNTDGLDGAGSVNNGGSTPATITGVTPGVANDLAYAFVGTAANDIVTPAGFSADQEADHSSTAVVRDFWGQLSGSSATGNFSTTVSSSWTAFLLLLKPKSGSPTCTGPPVPQGVATASATTGSTLTMAAPGAASSTNNQLLACVMAGNAVSADAGILPPSNWSVAKGCNNGSTGSTLNHIDCFTHTWQTGETSYLFTASNNSPTFAGFIEAFSNANIGGPIDSTDACSTIAGGSNSTIPATGFTPTLNDDLLVAVWGASAITGTQAVDGSMSALLGTGIPANNLNLAAASLAIGSGATGTKNSTVTAATGYAAMQIAIAGCTTAPTPTATPTPTPSPTPTATSTPTATPTPRPASYHGEVILFGF